MRLRPFLLLALLTLASLTLPTAALAACGPGTPFPQCDDNGCAPGLVCGNNGGSCGCVPPNSPCTAPGNPDGPPVCYGSCPNQNQICETLVGGCACIPTLSEWGIIGMSLAMFGSILWLRRRDLEG